MVILTGVTELSVETDRHPDDVTPPRSILDPPNEADEEDLSEDGENDLDDENEDEFEDYTNASSSIADTLTTRDTRDTRDTMSTAFGGRTAGTNNASTAHNRRRLRSKHPASLNEVELRIQLWDSYRLARIILGTPIKSFSLRGKTILHSIRKVAEMKLELIRMEKELEMAKVVAEVTQRPAFRSLHSSDTLPMNKPSHKGKKTSFADQLHSKLEDTAPIISPAIVTPTKSEVSDLAKTPKQSNQSSFVLQKTDEITNTDHQMEIFQIRYDRLQTTHEKTMKEFKSQLFCIQDQILESEQTEGQKQKEKEVIIEEEDVLSVPPKLERKGERRGLLKSWRKSSSSASSRRNKDKEMKNMKKGEDTLHAVATVAENYDLNSQSPEELELRMFLAKPSNELIQKKKKKRSDSTQPSSSSSVSKERKKLLDMIQRLMQQVENSSEETKLQFDALQKQLEEHNSRSQHNQSSTSTIVSPTAQSTDTDENIAQSQQDFQERLQTVKVLHTLEMETFRSKHIQQVVDLSGQLDSYQKQVDKQNSELQKWRKKYYELEEMAVTPQEAKDVLQELEGLPPSETVGVEEHSQVQAKAVRVLQRMAHLHSRQEKEQSIMEKTRKLAYAKEAQTQADVEDLRLQHQLLKEDTDVPPEEWQKQIAKQRRAFEREIKDLFKREERRMRELELLEQELTDLAFLAVEIEDLEKDCREVNEDFARHVSRAKKQMTAGASQIKKLHSEVQSLKANQTKVLEGFDQMWMEGTDIAAIQSRLRDRDRTNASREELSATKAELAASQQRVKELEEQLRQAQVS